MWNQYTTQKSTLYTNQYKLGVNALFVSTFWGHFYFSSYIFILLLLIPKPISVYHISSCRQPTNRKG